VGEPRTIELQNSIPPYKFQQLEQAQHAKCAKTSNPDACMLEWEQHPRTFT
jgi:hypothetical protein